MKLPRPLRPEALVSLGLLSLLLSGCGFHTPRAVPPEERLSVAAAPLLTPHPEALEAALAGARDELVNARALGSSAYPRLVIELTRVDELPSGIVAGGTGARQPLGRASDVGVVGRAYVVASQGGTPTRDTGDLRRVEAVAQGADPLPGSFAYGEAVRAAARRLGQALARRALGHAEPGLEDM